MPPGNYHATLGLRMGHCGRKKQNGPREPNGRLKRMEAAQRRAFIGERATVLAQPHRNGDLDQLVESPLGRFVLRNKMHRAVFDAGIEWGILVRHFYTAKMETKSVVSIGFGSGSGVSPEKAAWLQKEVERIETPLKQLSPVGFSGARDLAVFEKEPPPGSTSEVIGVLFGLVRLLRKIDGRG